MGGNGCSSFFFNSPQNFSTRECAHRNDTQKICIFSPTQRHLSSTYTVITRQILCKLEYGWAGLFFFCVCTVNLYRKTNFISIQLQNIFLFLYHPNIIQYYILYNISVGRCQSQSQSQIS